MNDPVLTMPMVHYRWRYPDGHPELLESFRDAAARYVHGRGTTVEPCDVFISPTTRNIVGATALQTHDDTFDVVVAVYDDAHNDWTRWTRFHDAGSMIGPEMWITDVIVNADDDTVVAVFTNTDDDGAVSFHVTTVFHAPRRDPW